MSSYDIKSDSVDAPSEQVILDRAKALIPYLKEHADQVEKNRMVSSETITKFKEAGFFKILQPKKYGGWEMSPGTFYKVLWELGRGCGSSAWNMMVLGVHQWEYGIMDPRAAEEVWGQDPNVITASSYAPWGECREVDGGYIISGAWKTSSGCDHAQWAFVGANRKNSEGAVVDRVAMLVSNENYTIIDDWYVFGLAGTGSKTLSVKETFIPYYRTHSLLDYKPECAWGDSHKLPFNQAFWSGVSSVIVGMAQGAIDVYIEQMKVRKDVSGRFNASLSPYVKDRLANAVAKVRSSKARLLNMLNTSEECIAAGEVVSFDDRVHYLLDIARVGRECEEAVMLLFKATGARGMYSSNPIQRILRDVIAGSQHITQNADDTAAWLGGYLLGQEVPPLVFSSNYS